MTARLARTSACALGIGRRRPARSFCRVPDFALCQRLLALLLLPAPRPPRASADRLRGLGLRNQSHGSRQGRSGPARLSSLDALEVVAGNREDSACATGPGNRPDQIWISEIAGVIDASGRSDTANRLAPRPRRGVASRVSSDRDKGVVAPSGSLRYRRPTRRSAALPIATEEELRRSPANSGIAIVPLPAEANSATGRDLLLLTQSDNLKSSDQNDASPPHTVFLRPAAEIADQAYLTSRLAGETDV